MSSSPSSARALRRGATRRATALLAGAVLTVPGSALLAGSAYAERGPAVVTVKAKAQDAAAKGHRAAATSTATIAQPLSNADQNGTGANPGTTAGCGAYCSSGVGLPTGNGIGDGNATGQPCAGCVGKADNKNPAGQAPSGPVDANAGYECDRNQGIGKTNPAHTGCRTPVVPVKTTTVPPVVTPPVVGPPSGVPTSGITPASPVLGPQPTPFGGSTGGPTIRPQGAVPPAPVAGVPTAPASGPTALPFTGDATSTALATGGLLLMTGLGLSVLGRRRAQAS